MDGKDSLFNILRCKVLNIQCNTFDFQYIPSHGVGPTKHSRGLDDIEHVWPLGKTYGWNNLS